MGMTNHIARRAVAAALIPALILGPSAPGFAAAAAPPIEADATKTLSAAQGLADKVNGIDPGQALNSVLNEFWSNARPEQPSDAVLADIPADRSVPTATIAVPPVPAARAIPSPEKAVESESLWDKITGAVGHAAESAYAWSFRQLNKVVPWYNLPTALAVMNLSALRIDLREYNLHRTSQLDARHGTTPPGTPERWQGARSPDGRYNDPKEPDMGRAEAPFGRNNPLNKTTCGPVPGKPEPREVSLRLFTRKKFKPATIVNNNAMNWLQFQVHDWVQHGRNARKPIEIPLKPGDTWPGGKMHLESSEQVPDDQRTSAPGPKVFPNKTSHWWDGSQIYGANEATQLKVRTGQDGKLRVEANGLLPIDPAHADATGKTGIDMTGRNDNYWLGLSMLHTLFTLEHNAIADKLKKEYPGMNDDELFDKARLVNAALIAKIHTVEWTPAILPNPALQIGMKANWWGLSGAIFGKDSKIRAMLPKNELLTGIPGSDTDHHAADYSLTQEFDIVYHMHPLVPDSYEAFSAADGRPLGTLQFDELQGVRTRDAVEKIGMANWFYSFGISHPGAITLGNFPSALQNFKHFTGRSGDLAAADIIRGRERCVPRYNDFREMLRMPRVKTFEELTGGDAELAKEISEVYEGDINQVDALVGMFAEPLPPGFGFSDTAFRIFIVMASRRLKSDRFLSKDYTPKMYTPAGYDWVENTTMRDVLLRHYPQLGPSLEGVENIFVGKWKQVGQ